MCRSETIVQCPRAPGVVAHLGERWFCKPEAEGSSPSDSTKLMVPDSMGLTLRRVVIGSNPFAGPSYCGNSAEEYLCVSP